MSEATESRQIETLRVLCITSMMWVHVNPGTSTLSTVSSGEFADLGWFLADVLGRTSVSTLSLISGYLLWKGNLHRPFGQLLTRQFRSVMLPMVVWGTLFVLLALVKTQFLGQPNAMTNIAQTPMGYVDAIFGLSGPTANLSLFFLRDLFVSSLILKLLLPAIRRVPLLTIAVVTLIAANGPLEPLLFRPTILLFLTIGAAIGRSGKSIDGLSRLHVALPSAIVVAAIYVSVELLGPQGSAWSIEIAGILRRLGLALLALALSGVLVRHLRFNALAPIGRHMYLCYLAHVPVIGIGWTIWTATIGGPLDDSYIAFFLLAPFACVALGCTFGTMMDHAPTGIQRLLRGKAMSRRPARLVPQLPQVALSGKASGGI